MIKTKTAARWHLAGAVNQMGGTNQVVVLQGEHADSAVPPSSIHRNWQLTTFQWLLRKKSNSGQTSFIASRPQDQYWYSMSAFKGVCSLGA